MIPQQFFGFYHQPSMVLKKMENFATEKVDGEMIKAINFMMEQLESLTQPELAFRLTMNCINCYVQPQKICHLYNDNRCI
ncbi:maspardin-like [Camponotus floridanus]|uniref:maspardin-like n=1 Tax=Camponotus floridanus TaxID=104421 RepID=UPI000DC69EDB|nr:maspardin-like [Camponotus floridanus]